MHEVQWSDRLLRVKAFGNIRSEAFLHVARALTSDTRYDRLQFIAVDFLDVEQSDAHLPGMVEDLFVTLVGASASNPNVRYAVVVCDPCLLELVQALRRYSLDDALQIRVFADRASMEAWITQQPMRSRPSMRFRPR
jgi:hypothetical protein